MTECKTLAGPREWPVPEITQENARFFDGCAEGRLLIEECAACRRLQHYPRGACTVCCGPVGWREVSGHGIVYAFTIIRYTRDEPFDGATPYIVGLIDLPEGVRILANICAPDLSDVAIGAAVIVRFAKCGGGSGVFLPYFVLSDVSDG